MVEIYSPKVHYISAVVQIAGKPMIELQFGCHDSSCEVDFPLLGLASFYLTILPSTSSRYNIVNTHFPVASTLAASIYTTTPASRRH
jgi:hypothetical protein